MELKLNKLEHLGSTIVIEKDAKLPHGQFQAILSTESLDRHGEIVSIKGMDIPKNQVVKMYYNHQTSGDALPIGKWLKIWKTADNQLMGLGEIDLNDPFATMVYSKIQNGFIDSISIGFYPKEYDGDTSTWTKSSLVEASVVAEPANTDAKITAKQLGFTEQEFQAKLLVKLAEVEKKAPDWVAIPINHTSVDANSAWSASDNVKRIPDSAGAAELKTMYACLDKNGNPHVKSSYKFPHHMVDADGKIGAANLKACTAGIAVLNGGRGGAKIGSARQGVYDHLAAHIKDANETPPGLKSLDDEMVSIKMVQKGAVADVLVAGDKYEMMEDFYEVIDAFCQAYYNPDTPTTDFNQLLSETIGILQTIVDGNYQYEDEDDGEDGAINTEVLAALKELKSRIGAVETAVKASADSPAMKQLIRVRVAGKEVDKAAEELNRVVKVKLMEAQ